MDLPDLKEHGYEAIRALGMNAEGGRITLLARDLSTQQQVVVKQFRFAMASSSWEGLTSHEREIRSLQELHHPRIPRLLRSFETKDGFCLVQAYLAYPSLATRLSFDLLELRRITESVLEILVYLQTRVPPIIHRDLKPANMLLDGEGRIYLVDFGLARAGAGARSGSTIAVGTPGYMPPEQLFGRTLNESSDLYALGATLIGILCGRSANEVPDLVNNTFQFKLDELPRSLPRAWILWLAKLVEPEMENRFPSARAALEELSGVIDDAPSRVATRENVVESKRVERGGGRGLLAIAALVFASLSAGVWMMMNRHEENGSAIKSDLIAPIIAVGRDSSAVAKPLLEPLHEVPADAPVPTSTQPVAADDPPIPKVETDEKKHDRWGSGACNGVVACYREHDFVGSASGTASAEIGPGGQATKGNYVGAAPRAIRNCIVSLMSKKSIAAEDWDKKGGKLFCRFAGTVNGGTIMMSNSWGFTPKGK